jgi:hypothetical protein
MNNWENEVIFESTLVDDKSKISDHVLIDEKDSFLMLMGLVCVCLFCFYRYYGKVTVDASSWKDTHTSPLPVNE